MATKFDFNTDRSDEAQAARYEALKGKLVLWLTCYYTAEIYNDLKFIMKDTVNTGVKLYSVFGLSPADRELEEKMMKDGLIAGAIFADMADDTTACDNILKAVMETGMTFDAVFSPHEVVQTLVGELAEKLKLPGNSLDAYVNARNKRLSREKCAAAGIPTPRFGRISTINDLEEVINTVGLPVVLKPTAGSASEGVYRCNTMDEAKMRFNTVTNEFKTNDAFSWNPGCEVSILCEEYIDGDEYDVDLLMWDGKAVYAGVTDNWPTLEPTFMETGSNFPSLAPDYVQTSVREYAVQCVQALGFKQGCFHVEVKYSMAPHRVTTGASGEKIGQPLLIEVNPRMGGGRTVKFHRDVSGVIIFENFLMTACGIPICPPVSKAPLCGLCEYEICAEKTGVQLHNRWLDHLKSLPNIEICKVYNEAGKRLKGADTGIPEWIGLLMVKGTDGADAVQYLKSLLPTIDPPIMRDQDKAAHVAVDATVEADQDIHA